MNYVKSCGFIAYKPVGDEIYYLIIRSLNGDVGFPKGHVEEGESEIETAVRELREETGIEVELVDGFKRQIEYLMPRSKAMKQVVYFLGRCLGDSIVCQQTEVASADFISYRDAIDVLTFDETKRILKDADDFIRRLM